jgi:glycosyltransferase involved in cell wall biosynthesis
VRPRRQGWVLTVSNEERILRGLLRGGLRRGHGESTDDQGPGFTNMAGRNPSGGETATPKPLVCLVGGPDVDARLDLMRLLSRDFDVFAAGTDARLAASFSDAGFRFRHYPMCRLVNPALDARTVWRLVRIFRAERPTIVHTFDTKPGVWGRIAARLAGVPVVVGTLPGLGSLYASPSWKGRLIRLVYEPLQSLASRWADLTIVQNSDDARELERRGVVPRGRGTIIPGSGVRTEVFTLSSSNGAQSKLRSDLGLDGSGLVVTMVSRIVRAKGVLDFAAAARMVREAEPGIAFLLVGPADADSLDALTADELKELDRSVTWIGPRRDVKELLALSDVFVFPSFYREGIPRVLLEAASMGLPLVAAAGPGSNDVVEDGVNGLLVPPKDAAAIADAVLRLARAPELRARFSREARERAVAHFDLSVVAEQTRSLYEALLSDKHLAAARTST